MGVLTFLLSAADHCAIFGQLERPGFRGPAPGDQESARRKPVLAEK